MLFLSQELQALQNFKQTEANKILVSWLTNHIGILDKKFGLFLKNENNLF